MQKAFAQVLKLRNGTWMPKFLLKAGKIKEVKNETRTEKINPLLSAGRGICFSGCQQT
ncbi:Uncharacterized protein dnm_082380 [Desulfonema magnum]|uniref:Uncharacterized protein n=1 Tax=Desulfonema magnum TaxID=45655 RepID=A0A975BVA9_9BACT|nr:Uncharacterized protein dnm_082380 [Desulfonema magnum]